jgi:hypothetical protein
MRTDHNLNHLNKSCRLSQEAPRKPEKVDVGQWCWHDARNRRMNNGKPITKMLRGSKSDTQHQAMNLKTNITSHKQILSKGYSFCWPGFIENVPAIHIKHIVGLDAPVTTHRHQRNILMTKRISRI